MESIVGETGQIKSNINTSVADWKIWIDTIVFSWAECVIKTEANESKAVEHIKVFFFFCKLLTHMSIQARMQANAYTLRLHTSIGRSVCINIFIE